MTKLPHRLRGPGLTALLIPLAFILAGAGMSRAQGIRDYSSHRTPAVDLPAAGGSYVDPVFGTKIVRITDASAGQHCMHAYSYWPAFNADDTRLLLACDGEARLYRFDAASDRFTPDGRLQGDDGVQVEWQGAYWSHDEPNIIYALGGTKLWRIDVARRGQAGYTLIRDFAGQVPYEFTASQLTMSTDERVFSFHTRGVGAESRRDALVYDHDAGQVFVYPRGDFAVDESQVDKLGRFVAVFGSSSDQAMHIWRFRTGEVDVCAWGDPECKVSGHFDLGADYVVNSDGWQTGLLARRADALFGAANLANLVKYLGSDGGLNWSIADHVSLRTDDETFAVGSTYEGDGSGIFENEIYLVRTDGSGFVRLAHTRSVGASPDSDWAYWAQPRAVVDRFGRYVVFTSDLGSADRTDVLMLKIPNELWPDGDATAADPGTVSTEDSTDDSTGGAATGEAVTSGGGGCAVAAAGTSHGVRGPAGALALVLALALAALCRPRLARWRSSRTSASSAARS